MTKQELRLRHLQEKEMLKILISFSAHDEEILNLLLERFKEVVKILEKLEKDIENEKE